jgi:hypothetical protein
MATRYAGEEFGHNVYRPPGLHDSAKLLHGTADIGNMLKGREGERAVEGCVVKGQTLRVHSVDPRPVHTATEHVSQSPAFTAIDAEGLAYYRFHATVKAVGAQEFSVRQWVTKTGNDIKVDRCN